MPAAAAVIAVFVCIQMLPSASHATEKKEESPAAWSSEPTDEEDETTDHDDGSGTLTDRYMHLDLRDMKPLSREEEEALLGNWGDSDAEDGD